MKNRIWICLMLVVLILCAGCNNQEEGNTQPSQETLAQETIQVTEITEDVQQIQPTETEETVPPTQTQQSFSQLQPGYYILTTYRSDDGMSMEGEAAKQMMWYITVNENRSGQFFQYGVLSRLEWSDRYVIMDGYDVKYTIEGDQIIMDRAGVDELTFTYYGQTLPEYLQHPELKAGDYYLYMYEEGDELYIIEEPGSDPVDLELREDKTGTLRFFVDDVELKWENNNIHSQSSYMPYIYYEVEQDGVNVGVLIIEISPTYTLYLCTEGLMPDEVFFGIVDDV